MKVDRRDVGAAARLQGKTFETEVEQAVVSYNNVWSMRIRDGGNGERPGDFIVLFDEFRLLIEAKATTKNNFNINTMIKSHQVKSLKAFSKVHKYNEGVFFIKFCSLNIVYCITVNHFVQIVAKRLSLNMGVSLFKKYNNSKCCNVTTSTKLIDPDLVYKYLEKCVCC